MEKLVNKMEEFVKETDRNICEIENKDKPWINRFVELQAEEIKKLAIEFSKYLRVNDYLPQLLEDRSIGYVIAREAYRSDKIAETHSADEVFNQFLDEYYK